jgi:hypothetical protein
MILAFWLFNGMFGAWHKDSFSFEVIIFNVDSEFSIRILIQRDRLVTTLLENPCAKLNSPIAGEHLQ